MLRVWSCPAVLLLLVTGCVPRDRLNANCEFRESARTLDLTVAADRRHLRTDAQVAEELGVRNGDATRGRESIPERTARSEGCTGAVFDQISRIHGVSKSLVAQAAQQRELWLDVVLVFLPVTIVALFIYMAMAERFNQRFAAEEPAIWFVVAILTAVVVSLLTMFAGEMWSWLVEMIRIDDLHISYRAFQLPWARHRWLIYLVSVVVFLIMAHRGKTRVLRAS